MQIPKRKPGKYNSSYDPHVTRAKLTELTATLAQLKIAQPRAALETQRLAAHGDFSENAGYQVVKARLRAINQRIVELEDYLKHAQVIELNQQTNIVQLGHRVTVECDGRRTTYHILGSTETNPSAGVISHQSPLGAALLSHRVADVVAVDLSTGEKYYTIISIELE